MDHSTKTPRLLIVDDEESVRTFVERVLRDAGYEVLAAASAAEALTLVEERGPFDLFVLDVRLPAMQGDALAQELRRRVGRSRVLYFTGAGDRLLLREAFLWGDEAFLAKPASRQGLTEAVALMLGAWSDRDSRPSPQTLPDDPSDAIEIDMSGFVELGACLIQLRQLCEEWFHAAGDSAQLREITSRLRPALDAATRALRSDGE
jgi:CheY-like chemotaxis protein